MFAPMKAFYPSRDPGIPDCGRAAVGVNPSGVADVLKEGCYHVGWLGVPRKNGKLDKKPINPCTGELASTTDPKTWGTFGEAFAGYEAGLYHGVSRVLTEEDDLVGIDLDQAFSGPAKWAEECQKIVSQIDSYTEVSPGGDGLRIFVHGKLPPEGRKKGRFECYECARHLTLTGHRLEEAPATVHHRQDELEALHQRVFGKQGKETTTLPTSVPGSTLEDGEVVTRIMRSHQAEGFARLWSGDRSAYPSASEADLALVGILLFWTGGDVAQTDRLFRQSGLMRLKWLRGDYRDRTLRKALHSRTEFYSPRRRRKPRVYATHREMVRLSV